MFHRRTSAALCAVLVTLALTGCAGPSAGPAPTATVPAPPASEPPQTPKPAPEIDLDDPATWIITSSGIGPVQLGSDFSDTIDALPDTWTHSTEQCAWMAWLTQGDTVIWFAQDSDSPQSPVSTVVAERSSADGAAGADGGPKTTDGLGLGASHADILAVHPEATEMPATIGDSTFLAVADAGVGTIYFEFASESETASSVTITERAEPAYEVCG